MVNDKFTIILTHSIQKINHYTNAIFKKNHLSGFSTALLSLKITQKFLLLQSIGWEMTEVDDMTILDEFFIIFIGSYLFLSLSSKRGVNQ